MKPLHIRHGLIYPADGGGVAYGSFGAIARLEFGAVGATQSDLVEVELLSSAGMTGRNIGFGGDKELHEVSTNVALSIAETLAIERLSERKGGTIRIMCILLARIHEATFGIEGLHAALFGAAVISSTAGFVGRAFFPRGEFVGAIVTRPPLARGVRGG